MMMTSLYPVPTLTLIRWLRPFLPIHQILRSGQMSGDLPFLLQSPPSLYSPLNLRNLAPILKSLWTTTYCPWKGLPVYFDPSQANSNSMPYQNFSYPGLTRVTKRTPFVLMALTGTNWGQQKETIIITYNSFIQSLFMYAAPIWFPSTSPSHIQKLQTIQNSALRIATGCVKITSIDDLHEETEMLTDQDHLSLISFQYLDRALQPNNLPIL